MIQIVANSIIGKVGNMLVNYCPILYVGTGL